MLYLIKSNNYLKIGFTENESTFQNRLHSYQCHNPSFEVLEVCEGTIQDENSLHKLCEEYKYRTEWFYHSEEVLQIWKDYTKSFRKITSYNDIIPPLFNVNDCYAEICKEIHSVYKDGDVVNRKELKHNLTLISKKYGVPILKKATDIEKYGFRLKTIALYDDEKYTGSYAVLKVSKK